MHVVCCQKLSGLLSEIEMLREYACNLKLDIKGRAETFLDNRVIDAEISVEGYKYYRKDKVKEDKVRGVILYVKNDVVSY